MRDLAVVIPAFQPGQALLSTVRELADSPWSSIIVVDDGSGTVFDAVFESARHIRGVHVLHHAINQGKGAALKTGIHHALHAASDLRGIITADADGQHLAADIRKVAAAFAHAPECLVLGSRTFGQQTPARSRFGNFLTRHIVRLLVGEHLSDTQTGLRAIPAGFASALLSIPSAGYEFELDMLIAARNAGLTIVETPIQTVYTPRNESSHFNPLLDSMKVYFVLLRFCWVALATAVLDNIVFYLVYQHAHNLPGAQVAGRAAAVVFNYAMVKRRVFHAGNNDAVFVPRFLALVIASGAVSYAFIHGLVAATHAPVLAAKIAIESLLFLANFAIERDWVFAASKKSRGASVYP